MAKFDKGNTAGKQFTSDYQPDKEIWTEEVALSLFNDLIEWMYVDNKNFLFDEFLFDNPDLKNYGGKIYPDLIAYLYNKFPSCFELYKKAEKIQELRLKKYALHDKINPGMSKFLLSACHGLKEKSDITSDNKAIHTNTALTETQIDKLIDKL